VTGLGAPQDPFLAFANFQTDDEIIEQVMNEMTGQGSACLDISATQNNSHLDWDHGMLHASTDAAMTQLQSLNDTAMLPSPTLSQHEDSFLGALPTTSSSSSTRPTTTTPTSTSGSATKRSLDSPSSSGNSPAEPTKVQKRQKNTEAARRYRQRKVDRVTELEEALAAVSKERDELKLKLARAEAQADVLKGMIGK
jgi:hypothetical protein